MFIGEVTQFHRPNGRTTIEKVALDDRYRETYQLVRHLGLRLTAEVLGTANQVSVCLEDPELGDMLIEIIPIESSITPPIEKMLTEFSQEKYNRWSRNMIEAEGATWND